MAKVSCNTAGPGGTLMQSMNSAAVMQFAIVAFLVATSFSPAEARRAARPGEIAVPHAAREAVAPISGSRGAPLEKAFGIGERPSSLPGKLGTAGKSLSDLSTASIDRRAERVTALNKGENLTPAEVKLIEKIQGLRFEFFRRVKPEKLESILDAGKIATLESERAADPAFKSFTPPAEIALFGAEKYVFGWLGFWSATNKYGDVIIQVKESYWRPKSWSSSKSGYEYFMEAENRKRQAAGQPRLSEAELTYDRYDKPSSELLTEARRLLSEDVLTEKDYGMGSALDIMALLKSPAFRDSPAGKGLDTAALAAMSPEQLKEALIKIVRHEYTQNRQKVGFFEGKLEGDVPLSAIEKIQIPKSVPNAQQLAERFRQQGIEVELVP